MVLRDSGTPPRAVSPTGLSPSTAGLSSPLRLPPAGGTRAHAPHLPAVVPRGFGLGSPPFGRPYSGDPFWLLFLRVLRCFRSPRSRPLRGAGACSAPAGSPIRGSRVLSLPAATPGLSQLATPFFGARAEPSTGRLCRAERRFARRPARSGDWEGPAPPSGKPSGVTPPPHQPRLLREPSRPGVAPRATAASSRGGLPA